jgi:hypothetical protein
MHHHRHGHDDLLLLAALTAERRAREAHGAALAGGLVSGCIGVLVYAALLAVLLVVGSIL